MYQQFMLAIHWTADEVEEHIQLFHQIWGNFTNGMYLCGMKIKSSLYYIECIMTPSSSEKLEEKLVSHT